MIKHITLLALLIGFSWSSQAQSSGNTAPELTSTPPAVAPDVQQVSPAEPSTTATLAPPRKLSYGLSAGTQFSRLFGTTTYLEPSVMFPVSKRFSGYASLTFLNNFGSNFLGPRVENNGPNYTPYANQRYILNVGGNYMVNDRLNLTGSVWRDLNKNPLPPSLNSLNFNGTSGLHLRANYKVTEHLSVSGGIRYSNGNVYNNQFNNPGYPFGY